MKKILLLSLILSGSISLCAQDKNNSAKSSPLRFVSPSLTIATGLALCYFSKRLIKPAGIFSSAAKSADNLATAATGALLDFFSETPKVVAGALLGITGAGISLKGSYNFYKKL